ncbi:iron-containing alcohol dehydrogenase [Pantoea sp. 1.19]|uniref:iron-containing alcohol dehydrogenase n=1 Tax=Pantoea sp. 1.19 TaxID=1925589 RepID=UPI000949007E|nr:iron-containing alcohol dehydrogenase [Pantoea sp. 1.19]
MSTSLLIANRQLHFGRGSLQQLPALLGADPLPTLLFCNPSLQRGPHWATLDEALSPLLIGREVVTHEASPQEIDAWVSRWRGQARRIVAIGGGSVLDAAKAVAALCEQPLPCFRYLEKIGDTRLNGSTLPVIAVPTTAGTGSEATQNAVITDQAQRQVKASLRHENMVPAMAFLDASLLDSAPAPILAHCGIDAFTHLLEAWLSRTATRLTRESALQGMRLFMRAWPALAQQDAAGDEAREAMLLASWLGGQALSSAGLGVIHGLAGEIGAIKTWHHGEVCGRLLLPFLSLLNDSEHPQHQARVIELGEALFPLQHTAPARHLRDWLQQQACHPFWASPPTLSEEECDWILARANSKNSWVVWDREQCYALLRAAWPAA